MPAKTLLKWLELHFGKKLAKISTFLSLPRRCRAKSTGGSTHELDAHSWICSAHFILGEKSNDPLSPDYVPSIFAHTKSPLKRKLMKDMKRFEREHQKQREGDFLKSVLVLNIVNYTQALAQCASLEDECQSLRVECDQLMTNDTTKKLFN